MYAALGFQGALYQQFIAGKNFPAGLGQKARIDRHISVFLPRVPKFGIGMAYPSTSSGQGMPSFTAALRDSWPSRELKAGKAGNTFA